MIRTCTLAVTLLFAASPTWAQTPSADIRASLKLTQKVVVTDDQGRELKGKVSNLTPDALSLVVDGTSTDVPYDRIVRIAGPRDTLANGALIGFGVGAALALTARGTQDSRDWDTSPGAYVAGTLIFGGLGTAVGVGIDALIRRDREIYRRGGGAHATVAPALGRGLRGVVVSVTW